MEAIGRLAGGVAHDFNNILLVISAYSEMMRDASVADVARHAELTEIIDAVGRGRSLTRQLLAFSRQQVLQPVVLDPNVAVTELEGMLRRLIGEHIEVIVRLAPDLGRILADPGQLQQVLLNLAVNARDAMPEGGKLTITTTNVDVDEASRAVHGLEAPGEFVTISVSDTGSGMTPEVRGRIFEPFFTTKGPGKGTGLGLATVYGIVTQSGGTVTVYTEPGHGALFRIYLPRVHDGTLARRPAERAPNNGGTETILLVEDERAVRAAAAGMLRHLGYTVLIAEHAAEAIEVAATAGDQLDLVVSDVVMPKMDGPTLIARLRATRPELKAILMSGYAGDVMNVLTGLDGTTPFLEKPFSISDLAAKVRDTLDGVHPAESPTR
jgi:CheY-like chemotaxis protein